MKSRPSASFLRQPSNAASPEVAKAGSPGAGCPGWDSLGVATLPRLSASTLAFIARQDVALNKRAGWEQDALGRLVADLLAHGRVEVGWRESCGTTDPTMYTRRAWLALLPKLKKDGLEITEEPQKHGNGWATKGRGFWSSTIYALKAERSGAPEPLAKGPTPPIPSPTKGPETWD